MAPNQKLAAWIAEAEISKAEAARRFGYDRHNLHRILEGTARPSLDLAGRIAAATADAVPVADWAGFTPSTPAVAA